MFDKFSVEELNLMCIYNTCGRSVLITDLKTCLPYVPEPEIRGIFESTITKLEKISDDEFTDIGFYIADDSFDDREF